VAHGGKDQPNVPDPRLLGPENELAH